ncbi:MAG: MaoC family dehydratase [Actinomycetes bacterium]|jgi:acyl dehydratase|nr:MaoC family dehydratase [Acidimicrobiia bacterium]
MLQDILDRLQPLVGTEIGVSDWLTIDQDRIDAFADATGDHQWIHVDAEKAAAGPFGSTIAHGFLTLSLTVALTQGIELDMGEPKMAINYGLDKVRFTAPVPVGSRIRARVELMDVAEKGGGIQVKRKVTIEREGEERPAMVAETLSLYYY